MAKLSGLGDNFYVAGYNLSGDTASLSRIGGGPAAMDLTGIDKSAFERIGGRRDGSMEWTSWFNDAAGQAHQVLSALPTGNVICTYCRGTQLGNPAASMVAKQINYDPTRGADGVLSINVSAQSTDYGLEWGQQLTAGQRTDTTATSPATGLDGGGSTTFGAQAYLQVFAFTGTSVTVTLQDSADNSTFAAIASPMAFAAASGITTERIAITGTVRRYVRAITSGTFSNAVFSVNFIRNDTAVVF
jgi:hypothetical protein